MMSSFSITTNGNDDDSPTAIQRRQSFSLSNGISHHDEESGTGTQQNGILIVNNTLAQTYINEITNLLGKLPPNAITLAPDTFSNLPSDIKKLTTLFADLSKFAELAKQDKTLCDDSQKLALENSKLLIMRIALLQLSTLTPAVPTITTRITGLQILGVIASLVLGVIYSGAESFTGTYDLFANVFLVPLLPTFIISVVCAILSNLLFFALEAKGFMDEFGIQSPFNISKTLQVAKNKLDVAKVFSNILRSPISNGIPTASVAQLNLYKDNIALLKLFQDDIINDSKLMAPPDNFLNLYAKPAIKNFFSFVGALLFACGGLIIGRDLIGNIIGLGIVVSPPLAFAIGATLTVGGFVLYFALQHRGVFNLFDALTGRPKDLLDDQKAFCDDIPHINENIQKNIIQSIPSRRALNSLLFNSSNSHRTTPTTRVTAASPANSQTNGITSNGYYGRHFQPQPQPLHVVTPEKEPYQRKRTLSAPS